MQIIPVTSTDERDEFETDVGETTVRIVTWWNERADNRTLTGERTQGAWFFDLYAGEEPIVYNVRVACGVRIADHVRHPLFRDGALVAVDTSGRGVDPGRYDLGERVQLVYYPRDEVDATRRLVTIELGG